MVSSTLITRAAWGAQAPKNVTPLVASEQRGVAIHYSAAEADRVASHDDCAGRVRAIQNFHMDGRGWADIAYSWLVCHHGYRFAGRGLGVRTAAQGTNSGNDGYHAVCFLGADREGRADVTDAAKYAITDCIATVVARYPHATAVLPHSAFHSTECPGDELRAWIAAGLPLPSATTTTAQEEDPMAFPTDAELAKLEDTIARGVKRGLNGALTRYGGTDSNHTMLEFLQQLERIGDGIEIVTSVPESAPAPEPPPVT